MRTGDEANERRPNDNAWQSHRGLVLAGLAILAVWLWVTLPLALGQESLFFRDVLDNHFALKTFGASELARGEIPAVNPTLGVGQPFRGNPSALAFYPGNLLYLLLPFWSAFNLHFALHWVLALGTMTFLARRLGMEPAAALMAGLTYAGSGWFLSTLSFYNVVGVAAWWPLVMAGAVAGGGRRGRLRGVALAGAACGMALLAGEPLTAALGLAPLLILAVGRHGVVRGLTDAFAIGTVGLAVAAPQVVATLRVLGHSLRGTVGVSTNVAKFSLPPLRLTELAIPLPFGWPMDLGPHGWWLWRTAPDTGFFLSLYAGIVALWLALRAVRRRPAWAALGVVGLAGAVLLALVPEAVQRFTGGLFRYPEKLLFWYALVLPLLAGQGLHGALAAGARPSPSGEEEPAGEQPAGEGPEGEESDRATGSPRLARPPWGAVVAGGLLVAAAVAAAMLTPSLADASADPALVATQGIHLMTYLTVAGVLLLAGAAALRRRAGAVLVMLQLLALVQLFPLLRTIPTAPLSTPPPWAELVGTAPVGEGPGVFNTLTPSPPWEEPPPGVDRDASRADRDLRHALDLYPAPSLAFGLTYPMASNIEGLAPSLYSLAMIQTQAQNWVGRRSWLRTMGVDALVTYRPVRQAGLRLRERAVHRGVPAYLYAVEGSAPDAWWPRRVEPAAGPRAAFGQVTALENPVATVVVPPDVEHDPRGSVRVDLMRPDRMELAVSSVAGGLLVVRRSFNLLYEARSGEVALETVPANVTLLGVEVPPGEHRVIIEVGDGPETAGLALSLLTLLAIAGVAWVARPRSPGAPPAPGPAEAAGDDGGGDGFDEGGDDDAGGDAGDGSPTA